MSKVETTAGPIDTSELGRTLTHEHLITGSEEVRAQWPHAFDRKADLEVSIADFEKLRAKGVETVCDPACTGIGRDVTLNIAVTEATGVRFVMATGLYPNGYQLLPLAVEGRREDLVDYFVHDIEVGIQGTDVKAGFLKCAADTTAMAPASVTLHEEIVDTPPMNPAVVTLHEKIAEASVRTGTPIMAHSNPNVVGLSLEQMKLFTDAGVDPSMVQIAHVGDTTDVDYIERILETGCYIGLDRYGLSLPELPSAEQRNATVLALLERGHGDRMMLSCDYSMVWDYMSYESMRERFPDWYSTYLFDEVLPDLREAGVTEDQIDAMLGSNVHAWLGGAAGA